MTIILMTLLTHYDYLTKKRKREILMGNLQEDDSLGLNLPESLDVPSAVLVVSMINGRIHIDYDAQDMGDLYRLINNCLSDGGRTIFKRQHPKISNKVKHCIHPMDVFGPKLNLGEL